MKSRYLIIALTAAITASALLRLTPTLLLGEPFSTDVWPLIRITDKLLGNPSLRFWEDKYFDTHDNRWPGSILAVTINSIITGTNAQAMYRFIYPAVIAVVTAILIYSLARRLGGSRTACVAAASYIILTPSLLVFTSSLLKEVYAYPLLISTILIASRWRKISTVAALVPLAITLSITHPLASLMTIALTASIAAVSVIEQVKGSRKELPGLEGFLIAALFTAAAFTTYYALYGYVGFTLPVSLGGALTYAIYAALVYTAYLMSRGLGGSKPLIAAALIAATASVLVACRTTFLPGINVRTYEILVYAAPLLIPLFLITLLGKCRKPLYAVATASLLIVGLNALYAVIGNPALSTVFHRVINYLTIANALLIAAVLSASKLVRAAKVVASASIVAAVILSSIAVFSIVSDNDYVTFYWRYCPADVEGFNVVSSLTYGNLTLSGDAKVNYYLLMVRKVDQLKLIKDSLEGGALSNNTVAILYKDNYVKGYAFALSIYRINALIKRLSLENRLFDNSLVNAFEGVSGGGGARA